MSKYCTMYLCYTAGKFWTFHIVNISHYECFTLFHGLIAHWVNKYFTIYVYICCLAGVHTCTWSHIQCLRDRHLDWRSVLPECWLVNARTGAIRGNGKETISSWYVSRVSVSHFEHIYTVMIGKRQDWGYQRKWEGNYLFLVCFTCQQRFTFWTVHIMIYMHAW